MRAPSDGPIPGQPSGGLRATLLPAQAGQALLLVLLAPVVPLMAADFARSGESESDLLAQLVVVTPFLGMIVGGLTSGWAIARAGLKPLILLAAAGYALGGAIGLFAPTVPILLVGCALLGLGAAFLLSGLSAVTAMHYFEPARGRFVGLQAATGNLFTVLFGIGTAFLAERLGWRTPFGVYAAFGAMMLLLSLRFVPRTTFAPVGAAGARPHGVARRVWPVCLAAFILFAIAATQSTQLPFHLAANGVTNSGMRAVVLTFTTALALIGSLAYSAAQGRLSERLIVLVAGLVGVAGWVAFALWSGGLPLAFLAAALLGFSAGVFIPLLYAAAMRVAPGQASGKAIGLVNAALYSGSFVNPALVSPLRAALGLPGLMLALALATAVGIAVALIWPRRPPHPVA